MSIDRRLVALVALALVLLHVSAPAGQAQAHLLTRSSASLPEVAKGPFLSQRLIVGLRAGTDFSTRSLARGVLPFQQRWGGAVLSATHVADDDYVLDTRSIRAAQTLARRIAADPAVEYVEPEYHYQAMVRPNDFYYDRLHGLPRISAEQAWDISTGNPNTLLAVVDTGIYAGHPDLGQNIVNGFDFVNGDADASDDEGHGTHTAGIVAAVGNNGRGVAGMCWQCRVLAVKVLDQDGGGSSSSVSAGIRYAADQGARVINLSLGGPNDSRLLHDAVRYATDRGALVVVASGNEAEEGNPIEYPAAYPEALAVGAIDMDDTHASFSNYADYVDVSAPGVDIGSTGWAADDPEPYFAASGTSEAAPFVTGLAGLIWSVNPALTNEDVRRVILSTADDLGAPGPDPFFGAGRINAYKALLTTAPPPPPVVPPDGVLFPETGKILRGEFRNFWEANGGLPVFGFPITDEQIEQTPDGAFLVQYFERNRFELHPENAAPYNVLLGRLGDTQLTRAGTDWSTLPKGQPVNGCMFFAETGHTLCEPFLSYWRGHGLQDARIDANSRSLGLFGLPLTEPRMETNGSGDTVMTQWFERARFEDHGAQGVLLGLLGNESRTTLPPPETPPLPPETPPPPIIDCPFIPPPVDANVRPSTCLTIGDDIGIDIYGFAPGEDIVYWLTAPDGSTVPFDDVFQAGPDGAVSGLEGNTSFLTPGLWFFVFQGRQSSHQSLVYFHLNP